MQSGQYHLCLSGFLQVKMLHSSSNMQVALGIHFLFTENVL